MDESGIQGTCHSFMVSIPIVSWGRREFRRSWTATSTWSRASGKASGIREILMPGEPEARSEERQLKDGVTLAAATAPDLAKLADRLGLAVKFMD